MLRTISLVRRLPLPNLATPPVKGIRCRRLRRELEMTFVVTDNCIKCKYTDCVEVCPVDCFYEGRISW